MGIMIDWGQGKERVKSCEGTALHSNSNLYYGLPGM